MRENKMFPAAPDNTQKQRIWDAHRRGRPERVPVLLSGSADQVYQRTKEILSSGVCEGGQFILKEANNLPPGVPYANLEAMYTACLEHGTYGELSSCFVPREPANES